MLSIKSVSKCLMITCIVLLLSQITACGSGGSSSEPESSQTDNNETVISGRA